MNAGSQFDLKIGSFITRVAGKEPDKTYLFFRNQRFSYSEFINKTRKASRAFQELNIGKGDRVCLLLPNCPDFLFAWLGLAQIGAIAVFVNTALKAREIQYIANHSKAKAIVTTFDFLESIPRNGSALPCLHHPAICVDAPPPGAISFQEMMESVSADFRQPSLNNDDVAAFIYTSGTTGLPKAVMQTHQTYVLTGESVPHWLGLGAEDRLFTCLPLFHINAQAYSVMGSLGAGASLILSDKFSATSFWDQVRAWEATEFNLIGAMPLLLLKQPVKDSERSHRVRIAYTAPALIPEDHEEFERRFGVTLSVGYGMSESTFGCINPIDKNKRQLGSIGLPRAHPNFGNQLRIVDENGQEAARQETGEIILKNPTVMKGYYKDPDATDASLRDGWLFTGDLAYQDENGFIYFAGRKKDMIRLKGENVSAYEVESVINDHPDVQESAVIGLPAEWGDEQIIAFVTKRPGKDAVTEADIVTWCRARLASFKVPVIVEFRDNLPKTPTQKIAKQILRDQAMDKPVRAG
jgi:carnitine-CoA ligase